MVNWSSNRASNCLHVHFNESEVVIEQCSQFLFLLTKRALSSNFNKPQIISSSFCLFPLGIRVIKGDYFQIYLSGEQIPLCAQLWIKMCIFVSHIALYNKICFYELLFVCFSGSLFSDSNSVTFNRGDADKDHQLFLISAPHSQRAAFWIHGSHTERRCGLLLRCE